MHMESILEILGLDLEDASIAETPARVAKMFVEEIFSGLDPANFPLISLLKEPFPKGEMVIIKNIHLVSFCEHHLLPMVGVAHVAFIPNEHLIGLSNVNRLVRFFSKRPQLQERLNGQIADCLSQLLQSEDVAVVLSLKHFCVIARGSEDQRSETETHVWKGSFKSDSALRQEFLLSINPLSQD